MAHWTHIFNPQRRANEWPKQLLGIMCCERSNENTMVNDSLFVEAAEQVNIL